MRVLLPLQFNELLSITKAALQSCRDYVKGKKSKFVSLEGLLLGIQQLNEIYLEESDHEAIAQQLATSRIMRTAVKQLEAINNLTPTAEILEQYYFEGMSDQQIANFHNYSRPQVQRIRTVGIEQLAEVLLAQEELNRHEYVAQLEEALPPPGYGQLLGRDDDVEILVNKLTDPGNFWIIGIIGIGGLGKTALTQTVVRKAISTLQFDRVIWLTVGGADPHGTNLPPRANFESLLTSLANELGIEDLEQLPVDGRKRFVKDRLKQIPHLIIVDNLEVEADTIYLLTHIHDLVNPSKFLITSRSHPPLKDDIFSYKLNTLEVEPALQLLRHYHRNSNLPELPPEAWLVEVYETVGGHPQALKLIASSAERRTMRNILHDLKQGQETGIRELYDRIYEEKWRQLSEVAQSLLQAMLLIPDTGATEEHLLAISCFNESDTWVAINQLISLSLLEVFQTEERIYYGIHRLTEVFLAKKWLDSTEAEFTYLKTNYIKNISANLDYWQRITSQSDYPRQLMQVRFGLIRGLTIGLEYSITWQPAVHLLLGLFTLVSQSGYWNDWIGLFQQASNMAPSDKLALKGRLLDRLGWLHRLNQDIDTAIALHKQAEEIALNALKDEKAIAQVRYSLSWDYHDKRDYERAELYGRQAWEAFQDQGLDSRYLAHPLNILGVITLAKGDFQKAKSYLLQAVQHFQETNNTIDEIRALNNLILALEKADELEEALRTYGRAWNLVSTIDSEIDKVMLQNSVCLVYARLGEFAQATDTLESTNSTYLRKSAHIYYQALTNHNLGELWLAQKQYNKAKGYLQHSTQLWRDTQDELMLANSLFNLSESLHALGEVNLAQENRYEAEHLLSQFHEGYLANQLRLKYAKQETKTQSARR